jgi:hypothetical protein
MYREYWRIKGLHKLNLIYKETDGKLSSFLKLYKELINKKGMSVEQVVNVVEIAIHKLPYMESLYREVKDEAEKMQHTRQNLSNDIEARKHKILLLDKIALSSEQECNRKEQQVQALSDKKNRLEKWITNVLNGEGYSKLKEVIKENIKDLLSDNKMVISVSFTAMIQTLKADPQMVKLVQNIPTVNNGKHNDNNNNNIIKYLVINKDSILELTEKNYENLVEALTNDSISSAAASSSNPTISLPSSSSSTFSDPSDQSDIYGIEKSESFHNNKGDIAD